MYSRGTNKNYERGCFIMTNARITRKAIEKALKIMVATAPSFVTFKRYCSEYCQKLIAKNDNYWIIWHEGDVFEIYNLRSKKSSFLDFSTELSEMD